MANQFDLLGRLAGGAVLLLDGAMGTELQRRGVPMDGRAWSAAANVTHPEAVSGIHADSIAAGAEIITTNTFPAARHVLEPAGMGDRTAEINRTAVALARRAADAAPHPVLVAGSLSSMAALDDWQETPRGPAAASAYREQAELLAEAGVDLMVAEMLLDPENAELVIGAAARTGLPVLVGWSAAGDEDGGITAFHDDVVPERRQIGFDDLVRLGTEMGGDVHGIMHSETAVTEPALEILRRHWDGPTMAYAETGRFEAPNWIFEGGAAPDGYAEAVAGWVEAGVQVVGGCCGTTPDHIAAIAGRLDR